MEERFFLFLPSALTLVLLGAICLILVNKLKAKILGMYREAALIPEAKLTKNTIKKFHEKAGLWVLAVMPIACLANVVYGLPFFLYLAVYYDSVSTSAWVAIVLSAFAIFCINKVFNASGQATRFSQEMKRAQSTLEKVGQVWRVGNGETERDKAKRPLWVRGANQTAGAAMSIAFYALPCYAVVAYQSLWLGALALFAPIMIMAAYFVLVYALVIVFTIIIGVVSAMAIPFPWIARIFSDRKDNAKIIFRRSN